MKKILLLLVFCLVTSITAVADEVKKDGESGKELRGMVTGVRTNHQGTVARSPSRFDINLIIEPELVTVFVSETLGIGTFQLNNLSSGEIVEGSINTYLENCAVIPILISDTSIVDFFIEFEDGSWCHLIWSSF